MFWHKVHIFLGFCAILVYAEIREHEGPTDCRKQRFYLSTYLSLNSKSWRSFLTWPSLLGHNQVIGRKSSSSSRKAPPGVKNNFHQSLDYAVNIGAMA